MELHRLHSWKVTPRRAVEIQKQLRARVLTRGHVRKVRLVAGADAAFDARSNTAFACVVVLAFPSLEVVEVVNQHAPISFPYVPGLLSFREAPPLLRAFKKLRHSPDVIFIDGHGVSHPRAAGIACHIGLWLDRPVIGCAKSVLVGRYEDPGPQRGAVSSLCNAEGRIIGSVVRTRDRVRPVFVSVGHRIALKEAVRLTLSCAKGYRIPEPTRLADHYAEKAKRAKTAGVRGKAQPKGRH